MTDLTKDDAVAVLRRAERFILRHGAKDSEAKIADAVALHALADAIEQGRVKDYDEWIIPAPRLP